MNNILGLDTPKLRMLVQQEGEPPYRGNQLTEWIYRRGARTFNSMSNLPKTLQTKLAQKYEVDVDTEHLAFSIKWNVFIVLKRS